MRRRAARKAGSAAREFATTKVPGMMTITAKSRSARRTAGSALRNPAPRESSAGNTEGHADDDAHQPDGRGEPHDAGCALPRAQPHRLEDREVVAATMDGRDQRVTECREGKEHEEHRERDGQRPDVAKKQHVLRERDGVDVVRDAVVQGALECGIRRPGARTRRRASSVSSSRPGSAERRVHRAWTPTALGRTTSAGSREAARFP